MNFERTIKFSKPYFSCNGLCAYCMETFMKETLIYLTVGGVRGKKKKSARLHDLPYSSSSVCSNNN